MDENNKQSAYDLEQFRSELKRERNKYRISPPRIKSRIEKEREQQLIEQMNRIQEKNTEAVPTETESSDEQNRPVEATEVKQPQMEQPVEAEQDEPAASEQQDAEAGTASEIMLLKEELKREKYKSRYASLLRSTTGTLVVVAALAILVATLWMPVLQIYGSSMTPTLQEGQIVVSVKGNDIEQGDLVAFYLGNKLLVKRVIAGPADFVDIDRNGNVRVNGELLDEPYVSEKALGECDLKFPYQVPDSRYFLMGDHRETSVDSRMSAVGCVAEEQIVGKIICCVWPLNNIEFFN